MTSSLDAGSEEKIEMTSSLQQEASTLSTSMLVFIIEVGRIFRTNILELENFIEELFDFYITVGAGGSDIFEDLVSCLESRKLKYSYKISIASLLSTVFKEDLYDLSPQRVKNLLKKNSNLLTENMGLRFQTIICADILFGNLF